MGIQLSNLQPEERIKYYQKAYEIMMDPNYDSKASKYDVLDLSVSRNKLYGWANHYILRYTNYEEEEKYYQAIAKRETTKAIQRVDKLIEKQKAAFDIFINGENVIQQFEKLAKKYNVNVKTIHKYKRDYLINANEEELKKYKQVSSIIKIKQHNASYSSENKNADIHKKVIGLTCPEKIKEFLDTNGLDY
ncbi:MAG: hypothetical protein PHX29_07025, partial [Dehalococcoidales bacterium]|nr:hypothetical protein [Dehalococcoidales bacterium]